MGTRRKARESVLQALFYMDMIQDISGNVLEMFCKNFPPDADSRPFFDRLMKGILESLTQLDRMVEKYASNWKIYRMSCVDRNILRIGTYELLFCKDIPGKVTINEAIEIAKKFGAENSGSFINGILDKIRMDIEPPVPEPEESKEESDKPELNE